MPLADRSENGRGDLTERKTCQQDKKLFRHRFKERIWGTSLTTCGCLIDLLFLVLFSQNISCWVSFSTSCVGLGGDMLGLMVPGGSLPPGGRRRRLLLYRPPPGKTVCGPLGGRPILVGITFCGPGAAHFSRYIFFGTTGGPF